VLANENTASASECLLGVLVHYGDVLKNNSDVILEMNEEGAYRTYGKGIMQTTYMLLSGGALKLTTAKIYWPDGETSIHGVGFTDGTKVGKGQSLTVALQKLA
jgi:carboxyl-terminal processing protease